MQSAVRVEVDAMPAFRGVDYLDFDSVLNDEELLVRQTAREFVDEQVIPVKPEFRRRR